MADKFEAGRSKASGPNELEKGEPPSGAGRGFQNQQA